MYLYLGQNTVVEASSIVAIFDMDNTTGSRITRDFLNRAEKDGRVINVSEDLPKSFVICNEGGKTLVYLSQLASTTLMRRSGTIFEQAGGI